MPSGIAYPDLTPAQMTDIISYILTLLGSH
jgi:hypothetical protein